MTEKDKHPIEAWEEPREYSSPACFSHEFEARERNANEARKALTLYHNPACSKSRETLALIQARGFQPRIVEYLKTPPTASELASIVRKLGIAPAALVRKSERVFMEKYSGRTLSDADWIMAMVADPILMERPILVHDTVAAIGRPPENVEPLLLGVAR